MALPSPSSGVNDNPGGIQFRDAKPILAGVVDNGVDPDDPRVMKRTNEAIKIVLDKMIPVGGMATYNITAVNQILVFPPQLENAYEAFPADPNTKVRGDTDNTQSWYDLVSNSAYLDPSQQHDNPLIDLGLKTDANDPSILHRVYQYPGLDPTNAVVTVTGAKRFLPITSDEDYLIVQNIEALKLIILSIERNENSAPDDAPKYKQQAFEMLEGEVKKHILDPRNYMRRKAAYFDDIENFPENSFGWIRANIAIDIEEALRTGKQDLTWSINQIERRIMQNGKLYKDMVITFTTTVVGGMIYTPVNVAGILAMDMNGIPIPIRSQFFQHLDNGPGMFPAHSMAIDQGDILLGGVQRRKYKLIADCTNGQPVSLVCQLRWISKNPNDQMTIKNYEAIRLLMTAKFLEEQEKWDVAGANEKKAFQLMETELQNYLKGIIFTPRVQTAGFSLNDVGCVL